MFVFFFLRNITFVCDDLTDGAGWGDDCAVLCFRQTLIFGFVIRMRCFCHLVIFFPRVLFRFWILLAQTGVLGFYIISRHEETFSYIF